MVESPQKEKIAVGKPHGAAENAALLHTLRHSGDIEKEVCFMFHILNTGIAGRYGVNAALVAQYIWERISENELAGRHQYEGRTWMRSSQMMFTAVMPYLSKHAIRRSLERLLKHGVIICGEFGESRFDRTSWYAFTQFGRLLMQESEGEDYE